MSEVICLTEGHTARKRLIQDASVRVLAPSLVSDLNLHSLSDRPYQR